MARDQLGPEVYEDRDPVQREAEGPSRSKAEDLVHVENVLSCSPPPPLAHKKYESVAAINFFLMPYSVASWSLLHCLTENL